MLVLNIRWVDIPFDPPGTLGGKVDIVDSASVETPSGQETIVNVELTLALAYKNTNSILGSETFTAKGMSRDVKSAVKKSFNKFNQ